MQRHNHVPRVGQAFKGPAQPRLKILARGDVIWLKVPQMLSPENRLREQGFKRRPFLVLEKTTIRVNENDFCIDGTQLLGVTGTSQDFLVDGRPHVPFSMPGRNSKTTYTFLDSICTLPCNGEHVKIAYSFKPGERQCLADGLHEVLQPEKRFFLKRIFNKDCMPGDIWRVKIATGDHRNPLIEADALMLLRRGRFFRSRDETGQTGFTPCLMAVLPGAFSAGDMRGLRWSDIRLVALHNRSLVGKVGEVTDETVSILLNTLRGRVGIPPIKYERPLVRHVFAWFNPLRLFAAGPGGL